MCIQPRSTLWLTISLYADAELYFIRGNARNPVCRGATYACALSSISAIPVSCASSLLRIYWQSRRLWPLERRRRQWDRFFAKAVRSMSQGARPNSNIGFRVLDIPPFCPNFPPAGDGMSRSSGCWERKSISDPFSSRRHAAAGYCDRHLVNYARITTGFIMLEVF